MNFTSLPHYYHPSGGCGRGMGTRPRLQREAEAQTKVLQVQTLPWQGQRLQPREHGTVLPARGTCTASEF